MLAYRNSRIGAMNTLGIHTVFLPRENISFLEEWLLYHTIIGVDHFYLYDNTGSRTLDCGDNINVTGRNKYGIDVKSLTRQWSDKDIDMMMGQILSKFEGRCTLIPWQPKEDGVIVYGQIESIRDCLQKYGRENRWIGIIDLDEFLFSPNDLNIKALLKEAEAQNIVKLVIHQKKFSDRFLANNGRSGRFVTEIYSCIGNLKERWGPKNIVKPDQVDLKYFYKNGLVHDIPIKVGGLKKEFHNMAELRFNHYNVNDFQLLWMKQFTQNQSQIDAEDWGMARYKKWIDEHSFTNLF